MIKSLIAAYYKVFNKSKLKIRERFSGEENFFRREVTYYDDGRIAAGIKQMQEDYAKIAEEITFVQKNGGADKKARLEFLYKRQYEIVRLMAFQGSQSMKNVAGCLKLMEGLEDDFSLCLKALLAYDSGAHQEAYEILTAYITKHHSFGPHYLLHKVYGELLYERQEIEKAATFFFNVTQLCPDDVENHRRLADIYRRQKKDAAAYREDEIVALLEG